MITMWSLVCTGYWTAIRWSDGSNGIMQHMNEYEHNENIMMDIEMFPKERSHH